MNRPLKKARKAQARLRAAPTRLSLAPPTEWASLLGELSPGDRPPEWRVHDRTHLEFAVDYPVDGNANYVWEACFFIPESLRVDAASYPKGEIYQDLHSYVRFAVPGVPLEQLVKSVERLDKYLGTAKATIELRLFASQVRTSISAARRHVRELIESNSDVAEEAATSLANQSRALVTAYRELRGGREGSTARIAYEYIDEDLSVLIETTLASLSLDLREAGYSTTAAKVASGAVAEAKYRASREMDGVGRAEADKRDVEHLEYRRHLLKRFSASSLNLDRQIDEAGRWTLQILYAVAASVAMAFAILLAFYHGATWQQLGDLWMWAVIVMLAYAGKDRIKASLQGVFSRWVSKKMPDRRWKLRDPDSKKVIGLVTERSDFSPQHQLPPGVMAVRNSTRTHPLERHARPENVLWHQKVCKWDGKVVRECDPRFVAVTEVFRLDLRRWLAHTDDPKQRIVFADPEDRHIYSATAPRVYNIAVVYRLRKADDDEAPWRRVRVVVSRKGILRVENVV